MPKIVKSEFINKLSIGAGISRQEAKTVAKFIGDCINDAMINGDEVKIRGFGSYKGTKAFDVPVKVNDRPITKSIRITRVFTCSEKLVLK